MLGLVDDLKQTRVYQEGREEGREEGEREGRQEGEKAIVLRLLQRRLGTVSPELKAQVEGLSLGQLEDLAEALLDFSSAADLSAWLSAKG